MTSNEAIEQGFIPYPYTFPAIKFEVSNEEALAILDAKAVADEGIPEIDDHLDTALELDFDLE